MTRVLLAALLGYGMVAAPHVTIDVSPRVVMADGALRLTCRVTRDERNRLLEYGVAGYSSSQHDLFGAGARVTWDTTIDHVPCGSGPAYCAVRAVDGRWASVERVVEIVGCN